MAFDVTIASLLNPAILGEESQMAEAAALAAESSKHTANEIAMSWVEHVSVQPCYTHITYYINTNMLLGLKKNS